MQLHQTYESLIWTGRERSHKNVSDPSNFWAYGMVVIMLRVLSMVYIYFAMEQGHNGIGVVICGARKGRSAGTRGKETPHCWIFMESTASFGNPGGDGPIIM